MSGLDYKAGSDIRACNFQTGFFDGSPETIAAMCWLSWCCRIFIVAMQVLVVVSGMQTSLVITGRYTGIRDWTIVTSPSRWQNAGSNFKSAWWRSSRSNGKLNLKAQLSLWHSWPVVKVYMLIKASLSLSYLSAVHSSSLSTHSFSIPPHVSSLMPGSYIMVMPKGFHFSSGTFHWCVFFFQCWLSVMTEDHLKLWSGTFIVWG